jgi:hypothetical protein
MLVVRTSARIPDARFDCAAQRATESAKVISDRIYEYTATWEIAAEVRRWTRSVEVWKCEVVDGVGGMVACLSTERAGEGVGTPTNRLCRMRSCSTRTDVVRLASRVPKKHSRTLLSRNYVPNWRISSSRPFDDLGRHSEHPPPLTRVLFAILVGPVP